MALVPFIATSATTKASRVVVDGKVVEVVAVAVAGEVEVGDGR